MILIEKKELFQGTFELILSRNYRADLIRIVDELKKGVSKPHKISLYTGNLCLNITDGECK